MKSFKQITEKNHSEWIEKCRNNFCARLKKIREEQKMSQREVAQKLGCAISTYANWEQGRTEPSIYDIFNLLLVFDIEANELFSLAE